ALPISPNGVVGLVRDFLRAVSPSRFDARAIGLLLLAIYCFLVGLCGVVFGLAAALGAKNTVFVGLGVCVVILALAYLAASYGFLDRQSWGPLLTTVVLALSIPLALIDLWLDRAPLNV